MCGVTGRNTSIGGAGRSSSGTYGETVHRAFGNTISGSVMGDDSGEDDADIARLSHDTSVSDVRLQQRTEARAIQAVRAAAGLGLGESVRDGMRSRDSEALLDSTQSRLFDDDDAGSHISINESFSLFEDERGLPDDESAGLRERFLRSPGGTRFDTDMGVEDEVEEGGGYRDSVVEGLFDRLRGSDSTDRGDMMMEEGMDIDNDTVSGSSIPDIRGGSLGSMSLGSQGHSQTQHSVGSGVRVDRSPVISAPSSLQWSDVPGSIHPLPASLPSSLHHSIPSMNSSSGFDLNAPDTSAGTGTARGGSCVVGELIAHKQVLKSLVNIVCMYICRQYSPTQCPLSCSPFQCIFINMIACLTSLP